MLRLRNATQTSVVLEWDPIELATAELRSLALYRNGAKAGAIPRPRDVTATKISGLAVDHEYTFQLVLRTSAGTHASARLAARTHKMTDLSGITVTAGVLPPPLRHALAEAVARVGARLVEGVRIDTTHFVCTEGRGRDWERAVEMNIPVVRPEWVEGCEREGRVVGVRAYYLNADPKMRNIGPVVGHQPQPPSRQRTESGAGAPRVPPASSGGDLATSRGSPQMAVPPESAGTDVSGVSPMGTVGDGQRAKEQSVPPTPPAKDARHRSGAAMESGSRDASVSPVDGVSAEEREEDEEDDEDEDEEPTGSKARTLTTPGAASGMAQSPFDSTQKEQDMPYRSGPVEDAEKRGPSDSGNFSDVAL